MNLDIVASGMVTPVGPTAARSLGAIRGCIDGFERSRFKFDGDRAIAAMVEWDDVPVQEKLAGMTVSAINECILVVTDEDVARGADTALALCLPEEDRPGRVAGLDQTFLELVCARMARRDLLADARRLFASGTLGAIHALAWADEILERGDAKQCLIVGVDSYVNIATMTALHAQGRLFTKRNSDGFIPGEAAAGVLVKRAAELPVVVECRGLGWGREEAIPGSGKPLRGDGLAEAYRAALKDARCGFRDVDYRLCDAGGEEFAFKEAALGLLRTMRVKKESFALWHTADCVGRVGAATVPLTLAVALAAARKRYAPGPGALCHFTDDTGARAATVLRTRDKRPAVTPWWQ